MLLACYADSTRRDVDSENSALVFHNFLSVRCRTERTVQRKLSYRFVERRKFDRRSCDAVSKALELEEMHSSFSIN